MSDLSEEEFLRNDLKGCPSPAEFERVCRVCLSRTRLHTIFKYRDALRRSPQDLSGRMRKCSGVKIKSGDGLPDKICENCINFLQIAVHFRTLSENSDRKLRDVLKYFAGKKTGHGNEENLKVDVKCEDSSGPDFETGDFNSCHDGKSVEYDKIENCNLSASNKSGEDFSFENDKDMIVILQTDSEFLNDNDHDGRKLDSEEDSEGKERMKFDFPSGDMTFYGCLLCEKRFPGKAELETHMAATHGEAESEEFRCHGCDEVFDKRCARLRHEKKSCMKMPPGSKYLCRKCPAELSTRVALERHLRQHAGGAPRTVELGQLFVCLVCRKTLLTRGTLRTHVRTMHGKSPRSLCSICNKTLKNKHALYTHMQTHTERGYACDQCAYRTNMRSSLRLHMRTHSGERPYACEWCAHRSVNISNLNRHRMTHTGVKNHKCKECDKRYTDKSTLTAHISSFHRGLRPFFCDKCGNTYARRKDLCMHLKKMHSD